METENSEISTQTPLSKSGLLTRPDGSAVYIYGKTAVLAGTYGPVEAKTQKISTEKAHVEALFKPKSRMQNLKDKLYETVIRNICETALVTTLYPRTTVLIIIQELQTSGNLISCSVNAACLALLDSGIDMKFLVAAVTCCLNEFGKLTLDPTNLEQDRAKATFVFVFNNDSGMVVATHTTGSFSISEYEEALQLCRKNSVAVFDYYKKVLVAKYS